tara:strand:+ start:482 stop:892 length:411 start_codon:yes stop_codon:yes gene_type:complete
MIFNVRVLNEEDYDTILLDWWKSWNWDAPQKDFLPDNGKGGIMILDGDTPICAGFIYVTNSSVSWIDWIISSKTYRKSPQRADAISLLIDTLTNLAKKNGSKYCYALLKHKGLIETYKKLGYISGDSYTQEMIKKI